MRRALALVVVAAVALVAAVAAQADAYPSWPTLPDSATVAKDRQMFLQVAEKGVATVNKVWRQPTHQFYDDFIGDDDPMPLARLWSAFPLFETLTAVATADPTDANKQALKTFADQAVDLYWNPNLSPIGGIKPVGGYEWYPHLTAPLETAYFDDNGWWGLAFIDAYKVLHDKRYLAAAHRAFQYIVVFGWDKNNGGGVWWDNVHHHKTIEPLAAAVLIGSYLYDQTHKRWYLQWVNKLLGWANKHSWNADRKLYGRSDTDGTTMDYAEGMMIAAHMQLCATLDRQDYCAKAQRLADAASVAFPPDLHWAPQYDVIYVRWMLDYYKRTHDARWYALAYSNAKRALQNAVDTRGYFVKGWDGRPISDGLEIEAANLELFAWLAAMPPPG